MIGSRRRIRLVARAVLALGACALVAAGCRRQPLPAETPGPARASGPLEHLHVLMLNGGGSKAMNYQSHLLHVQQLLDVLFHAGVRPERVSVFSADGPDPAEDLAVREVQPEPEFWLLRGTRLEHQLATPITYANSSVPGVELRAATKDNLRRWFKHAHRALGGRDTLLLYVTDHGQKNRDDPLNNSITLWGPNESLSVSELRELLGRLRPTVRVVMLMSQCYSGAFAHLVSLHPPDPPAGNLCGYFSSTADRPAYGCYPENRGKENVGHSFHFIQALATLRRFPDAHAQVLVRDATPDVPLRSSDAYLDDLLRRKAAESGTEPTALVDGLLREAWRDKAAWEPEIRLLDRIGHAFGCFSPRSLAELDGMQAVDITDKLKTYKSAWETSLRSLAGENLDRFIAASADWKERTQPERVAALDAAGTRALARALLTDLTAYTDGDATTARRLAVLRKKTEVAEAASYRMEVRLGVVLRMRAILTAVAGRVYLATHGTPEERAAYEALVRCENLDLGPGEGPLPLVTAAVAEPFPPYEDDVRLAAKVLPAWMGIRFKQAEVETREHHRLEAGAVAVEAVYPDSPAEAAGVQVGDVILGPPGAPFKENQQIREWTMLSKIGEPAPLLVLRGDRQLRVTLAPKPYPLQWTTAAGPPKVDAPAPPVTLTSYRGSVPPRLADGNAHLLFFWATYCGPCKASLPEVLAFERERHTQVIAVTDELREQLDAFFKKFDRPFPETVAMDEYRKAFLAFGVSGTPTFVLLDGAGKVRSYATGYTPEKGLGVAGWSWTKPAPAGG